MSDFIAYSATWRSRIQETLDQLIADKNVPYRTLFQAARYSVLGEGKCLRPLLTVITTAMLDQDPAIALIPACALEIVHSYSLIHDDLPCMDDDDFRRGKPSLHRVYREGHAILTGDFLLTYAFELLANAPHLSDNVKLELIRVLSAAAGGEGMVAGQVMDLQSEDAEIDLETLNLIHQKKTGALFTASIEFGAILAGVTTEQRDLLKQCGAHIGLAFQIADDILDAQASSIQGKASYASFLGIDPSHEIIKKLLQRTVDQLSQLPFDCTPLIHCLHHLVAPHYTQKA